MDLIYKIYSVWLYDHQMEYDYFILDNNEHIPNWLSLAFNMVYDIPKKDRKSKSGYIIEKSHYTHINNNTNLVKNNIFITQECIIKSKNNDNYKAYDIFWNETKSGIDITEYKYCHTYRNGDTSMSTWRIFEHHGERVSKIRDMQLVELLEV